jgi:hypothetical protein
MMKFPRLARRRLVWLPTLWGWAVLLSLGTAVTILAGRNLYTFLAVNQPMGARVLIVEGWMGPQALDEAVAAYRKGGYERLVTTGAPADLWSGRQGYANYADRAAAYLIERGIASSAVTAVPAPESAQDRTYLSAVVVRDWAQQSQLALPAVDVFSIGPHARRSRLLYQLAFGPTVKVGVWAASQASYPTSWWRTSTGVREVLDQAIALAWVEIFFWPSGDLTRQRYGGLGRNSWECSRRSPVAADQGFGGGQERFAAEVGHRRPKCTC